MKRALLVAALVVLLGAGGARADYIQFQADTSSGTNVGSVLSSNGSAATISFDGNGMSLSNGKALNGSNVIAPISLAGYGLTLNGAFSYTLSDIYNNGNSATLSGGSGSFSLSVNNGGVITTLQAGLNLNNISVVSPGPGDTFGGLSTVGELSLTFTPTNLTTSDNSSNYDPILARLDAIGGAQLQLGFIFPTDFTSLADLVNAGSGEAPFNEESTLNTVLVTSQDPMAPVPASWLMLATGTLLIGGFRRYRRRSALALA
jgi:hypothetical protein